MVARRRGRWSVALTILGALVAVAAGFSYIFWPQIFALIEEEIVEFLIEREQPFSKVTR